MSVALKSRGLISTHLEVCRRLKEDEATATIPIIMLTAKQSVDDKIEGFVNGADEYLVKPFHPKDIRSRVASILKMKEKKN